ncbi:GlxA family transcriptional regulator [Streptomonospora nanhaiensis]|uniref:Transcriptional regulator GlxA family with amidase domain n=1 Tax=Streptomonospora nanhaiensis TaxID=1323731 RepID=A0A853BXK8_9ACTN|nr:GlxA family transcriptional regulator [Streptomonospora nanhaiensis]MBV2366911.1 GlxA family transcriptional regulator [Streptomonospora nanhaiensis]MBX9391611.1 GlxA family transcriptional regulator [Streptomonospora nanhaiensis]NYI99197.1 transcriptional regulator GlxA family with amidase domain [Streptomonospora nanhaiensis]
MFVARRVVIAVFPDVDLLDVTGPAEVFSLANRVAPGKAGYEVRLAGPAAGEVRTSAGVRLVADLLFDGVDGGIDTLVVPGAVDMTERGPRARVDPGIVAWVRATAPRARRVASVCVGAHVLAAAGLLDGRSATTHWSTAAQLAADHPEVAVDPDPIFVRSGNGRLWTGAGISACLDLALALVAEDLGEDTALAVARQLVMYLKRQGGQSQFSVPLSRPPSASRAIDDLLLWIAEHLDADLSVEALADRMCLSTRHFARVFKQETGTGPAAYVEAARVEAARRLLETTDEPLDRVAAAAGLGSAETLHRAFRRRLATTPAAYRRRFRVRAA